MIMHPYNLLDHTPEVEVLHFCREERVGFFAYSPLAVGLLTGLLSPGPPAAARLGNGGAGPARRLRPNLPRASL